MMSDIIIGSHVSFLKDSELYGSVMESVSYGSNTFMIYTGSNQSAERREINHDLTLKGWEAMKEADIDINNVIVHAPFIVNLANNKDERKYNFYISFMKNEIERCKLLGIHKMVFHPGSRTDLDKETAKQINAIIEKDELSARLNQAKQERILRTAMNSYLEENNIPAEKGYQYSLDSNRK